MRVQVGDWVRWDQPGEDGVFIDEVGSVEGDRIYLEDGVGTIIYEHQILAIRPKSDPH